MIRMLGAMIDAADRADRLAAALAAEIADARRRVMSSETSRSRR
jgi:ABC-type Fe3+-hydroxamate transport system substrate-binding protein